MTRITWFDPGLSTGIVSGWFDETSHYEPREIVQLPGGPEALDAWLLNGPVPVHTSQGWADHIVGSEKFIPRPIPGGSHTLESTIPLVGEGVLCARGVMPFYPRGNWQPATSQLLKRHKDPEVARKLSDGLLQDLGLWLTGTDVGAGDANDVISATKHILWFLSRTLRHKPTLEFIYGEENR